jgi:GNAT superfamily N-acetyltransferase
MVKADIVAFPAAFSAENWSKPEKQFELYFVEQQNGTRQVFVAEFNGEVAGYATLLPQAPDGAFKGMNIPEILDFNVLIQFQRRGIGTAIMDAIETEVRGYSDRICLGVGLHRGYGTAQRMYVKRGYVPDGSGVWYGDEVQEPYAACRVDAALVLYLSKDL